MRTQLVLCFVALMAVSQRAEAQPRKLTLSNAIQAALENNASVQIAEEQKAQAGARVQEQRSVLLPNINASAGYVNQTINLGARGIRFPGIPTTVGPFSTLDARVQYTEPVLDLSLLKRYQSTKQSANASDFDTQAVRNQVAAMVARIYFAVQRARGLVEAVNAQIELGNNLLKLARDRQELGAGTGLDVTRAQSRLASDQFMLLQAQNEVRTSELQLLRAMGERPNVQLDLTDSLSDGAVPSETADAAVAIAARNRPELQAEEKRVEAARVSLGGSKAERLPTVQAFADYGDNGTRSVLVPTNTVGVQLQVPIFDGGRRSAHRTTAESLLHQAEVRARDKRDEIEFDVRVAVDNLASSREQLRAADEALKLGMEELNVSLLRFQAQVTTQLDVVNAQTQLADVRSRRVNALFAVKSAEVEYQRATGVEIR